MKQPDQTVHINDGDVLIFRGLDMPDDNFDLFAQELHTRYPNSFILLFPGEESLETMSEEHLHSTLEHLIAHQQGREAQA